MNRVVAVLGGTGFVGSNVCRKLVRKGYIVNLFVRHESCLDLISDIRDNIQIFYGDLTSKNDFLKFVSKAEILLNFVHSTTPHSSMENPVSDVEDNIVSLISWAQHLGKSNIKRLLYISSGGAVYGKSKSSIINESHPTDPISAYGITKLMSEKYCNMYALMAGIDCIVLRPSNIYGIGQRVVKNQGIIGVITHKAINGIPIEIWGDGNIEKDYIYIDDFVDAVLELLEYTGVHRVFNVSSGIGYSINDIVAILKDKIKAELKISYINSKQYDVPSNVLDCTLLSLETRWKPKISLNNGICKYLQSLN